MSRNNNHHREAAGPDKRKAVITTIANENNQQLTPIEEIFVAVMGREMLPEERDLLLKRKPERAKR